jgi:hypothetical protein
MRLAKLVGDDFSAGGRPYDLTIKQEQQTEIASLTGATVEPNQAPPRA